MNQYPLWKNLMVLLVVLLGGLFALPNLFDQDPSMEISAQRDAVIDQTTGSRVQQALDNVGITAKGMAQKNGKLLVRFLSSEDQLKAMDQIAAELGENYTPALTLSPDLPDWLVGLGAEPMYLGLDLRGGIHVLIDVDMEAAIEQAAERYSSDIRTLLRENKLRYIRISRENEQVVVKFNNPEKRDQASDL
ncbi:MAG: protein translocase subunit SecD, partial [Candidatus Thiodiazotropha sp.]